PRGAATTSAASSAPCSPRRLQVSCRRLRRKDDALVPAGAVAPVVLVLKVQALDDQLEVVAKAALQHSDHAAHIRAERRGFLPRLERVVAPPMLDLGVPRDAELEVSWRQLIGCGERALDHARPALDAAAERPELRPRSA